MAATGDFITQRLNGIKYFGKPPLQAWITALTFKAFGVGEWQARLWTGLCGLSSIVLIAYAGRRVFNQRVGLTAGLVLASSVFWGVAGHISSLDMGLSAMMTLALCALLLGQRDGATAREQRRWMLVCWAVMALAVLSKGLIGLFLPGAVLMLYTLVSRDWGIWKRLHFGGGLLVLFAILTPWFALVSLKNPEFAHFFFIREHFQRFTSDVHVRTQPWHYFIPLVIVGIMPWLAVLPQSLWNARLDAATGFQPKKLLLIWAGFIFIFFSVSSSKLPAYILPVFPALALLIAHYLEEASSKQVVFAAGLFGFCNLAGLLFVQRIPSLAGNAFELLLYQGYMRWITGAAVLGVAGGAVAMWLVRRRREWALITLAASGFLSGQALLVGHEPLGAYRAGVSYLPRIEVELTPHAAIYAVGLYEYALPFYLGRTLTLVQHAEDGMKLGLQEEPSLWLPGLEAFIDQWKADYANGRKAVAILRPDIFTDLRKRELPMRIVAQDSRRIIVTN
jgi:4-amino-4-deoxy-L-arabinose transferase-like glycosyltransferase